MAKLVMSNNVFQFVCDGERAALLVPGDSIGAVYVMEQAHIRNISLSHNIETTEIYSSDGYVHRVPIGGLSELDLNICASTIIRSTGPQALIDMGLVHNMTVSQLLAEIDRRLKKR